MSFTCCPLLLVTSTSLHFPKASWGKFQVMPPKKIFQKISIAWVSHVTTILCISGKTCRTLRRFNSWIFRYRIQPNSSVIFPGHSILDRPFIDSLHLHAMRLQDELPFHRWNDWGPPLRGTNEFLAMLKVPRSKKIATHPQSTPQAIPRSPIMKGIPL